MKNITIPALYESSGSKGQPVTMKLFQTAFIMMFFLLVLSIAPSTAQEHTLEVPYVTTPPDVVDKMLEVAQVEPGDYLIDLGCGDGRIVISAAKRGAWGHGVDLDPERISEARANAKRADVSDRVMFLKEDIFHTDFSRANVITMYLLGTVNLKLRPRLLTQLEPGTRVVSHDFDMGDWKPDKHVTLSEDDVFMPDWKKNGLLSSAIHDIYLWIIPAKIDGTWEWEAQGRHFVMDVAQKYQEIYLTLTAGKDTLRVQDKMLRGERISITANNPANGTQYVYNGHVNRYRMEGTVQVRTKGRQIINNWSASSEF